MSTRRLARVAVVILCTCALAVPAAPSASAQTPTPSPTGQPSNNPFATLEPISLLIWVGSVVVALVCVLYAVERERRKHEG